MANCRRVSSISGSRARRVRNASNASSGKSHGLGACLVTNLAREVATCSRVPCALRSRDRHRQAIRRSVTLEDFGIPERLSRDPASATPVQRQRLPYLRRLSLAATIAAKADTSSLKCVARHFEAITVAWATSKEVNLCCRNSTARTRLQQSEAASSRVPPAGPAPATPAPAVPRIHRHSTL